jgi:hypothetical protein
MTTYQRSPLRVAAAATVLVVAYLVTIVLFALGAVCGFGIFMMIPFWFAVPPLLEHSHEAARRLASKRAVAVPSFPRSASSEYVPQPPVQVRG